MGGTDDPSNLVSLTVEEHAQAHRKLYEEHGHWQDYVAWKGLSGQISTQEAIRLSQSQPHTPERRQKISKALKGRTASWAPANLGSWLGSNIPPNTKLWKITHPDGTVEETIGTADFCKKHNLSAGNLNRYGHTKGYRAECIGKYSEILNNIH